MVNGKQQISRDGVIQWIHFYTTSVRSTKASESRDQGAERNLSTRRLENSVRVQWKGIERKMFLALKITWALYPFLSNSTCSKKKIQKIQNSSEKKLKTTWYHCYYLTDVPQAHKRHSQESGDWLARTQSVWEGGLSSKSGHWEASAARTEKGVDGNQRRELREEGEHPARGCNGQTRTGGGSS